MAMCSFHLIISEQVLRCEVSSIINALSLIMAAQLSVCNKEQYSVIWFLWLEHTSRATVHQTLSAQYGNSVLVQHIVYEWIETFKYVRTSILHEEEARCP
jgi:hypothetical protein